MMGLCVDIVEVCGYLWIFMKVSLISQQICILWDVLPLIGFSSRTFIMSSRADTRKENVVFVFGLLMLWTVDILVPGQCPRTDVKGEI